MAKPACTFCETYEGLLMISDLDSGDTPILCAQCAPGFLLGITSVFIKGMTREQAEAHAEAFDQIYASDPRGPKSPPAAKRARPKRQPPPDVPRDEPEQDAARVVDLPEACSQCGSMTALGDAEKLVCKGCGMVIATAADSSPDRS